MPAPIGIHTALCGVWRPDSRIRGVAGCGQLSGPRDGSRSDALGLRFFQVVLELLALRIQRVQIVLCGEFARRFRDGTRTGAGACPGIRHDIETVGRAVALLDITAAFLGKTATGHGQPELPARKGSLSKICVSH